MRSDGRDDEVAAWRRLVETAARRGRRADLLLLADEAPLGALGAPARRIAAELPSAESGTSALFGGLMVDRPGRDTARFPPRLVQAAGGAIGAALDGIGAVSRGVCGGACGGDLLFAEACLARGVPVAVRIPFPVAGFVETSVAFAGGDWVERFHAVVGDPDVDLAVMTDRVGTGPDGGDPFERCNRWLLHEARVAGPPALVVLWDGAAGAGPGGTEHLYRISREGALSVTVIDPSDLEAP